MKLLALLLAALLLLFSAPRSAPERFVSGVFEGTPSSAQGRSGAPTGADQVATLVVTSARDPFNGRGSPRHRPARKSAETAVGAPLFAQTHIGSAAGSIRAIASYYGTGPAGVAAAGPNLRAALGSNWRGTWVRVTYAFTVMDSRGRVRHRSRSAWLRLGDSCWCNVADIDIPTRTFSDLSGGQLWRGLLRVTITWGDVPRLPATSTEDGWKP